jgi:hypothetical protein
VQLTGGRGPVCVWWGWRWWWWGGGGGGGGGFGRLKSAQERIARATTGGEISLLAMELRQRDTLDGEVAALLGAARDKRVRAVSTP